MPSDFSRLPIIRSVPLVFYQRKAFECFSGGDAKILVSVVFFFLIKILVDYRFVEGAEHFNLWGISSVIYPLFLLAGFWYLFSLIENRQLPISLFYSITVEIWVICYVVVVIVWSMVSQIYQLTVNPLYATILAQGLSTGGLAFLLYNVVDKNLYRLKGHILAYVSILVFPFAFFGFLNGEFWYPDYSEDYEPPPTLSNYDELLLRQPDMVDDAIDSLAMGKPGEMELYYLGFGSYASQSVFKNEVQYIAKLMQRDFSTANHSVQLINSFETIDDYPLAIGHNIDDALYGIAGKMDIEEDVLLFYLTSHGSKDHELSVSFYPLQLANITPEKLQYYIEESGIQWRIVIVSACYAGGYLDYLKDDKAIVLTAADADHTSFGCADKRAFTYFGEAVFKDNFSAKKPVITAFEDAIKNVALREISEERTPSNPLLWVGPEIRKHLERNE